MLINNAGLLPRNRDLESVTPEAMREAYEVGLRYSLKGEFTDFLKFNTTLGHIYTSHFTIKTPSDRFRMAVMAQNVVLFCTLLSLHKEKTLTTNIK